MGRRLAASVEEAHSCPMFEAGDRMSFDLPEVVTDDSNGVCAIALADILPAILRVAAGGRDPDSALACRGCRAGRAQATFRLELETSHIDEATRSALMPILANIPLFQGLSQRRLEKVLQVVSIKNYETGSNLLECGAVNQPLYIVVDGEVDILKPDGEGHLAKIASLGNGECIGEMSLLTGDPCSATIRCSRAVRALTITKEDFDRLLDQTPALNTYFSKLLAQRLKKTSGQLLEDLSKDHDISGDLSMLSPAEIVQAINATNRTGSLTIVGDERLVLVFDQGRIVRMETPVDPPEEAFFAAMTWKKGSFSFKVLDASNIQPNVYLDTMSLLLEGMRRTDEGPNLGLG